MLAQLILASFPGRFCGGEEKRPGHHCWRMRVVPIKTWEFVHVCTLSAYTLVISRNISVHDHERLATALTGSGVKLCFEKTLNMPFLAYYGCSKLLKAHAWGTHTRFTVSVGIDLSLTKTRRTRSADCIRMDKRARILVLYGKLYITRIRASYTWQYVKRNILLRFYGISHACANSGRFFPPPQKKRPGNEAKLIL